MAESIIGKNLDNVTNVAKGLDKEMLDMTYPNKYYQDVIQPAKLGQRPIPSRMEMLSKFQPVKAMRIGMDPYLPSFMGGGKYAVERAQPTAAASKFLNTIGKGAKFVGTKVGPFSLMDILASTPLGANDEVTDDMRNSIDTTGINSFRGDYTRASNEEFQNLLSEPRDYTEGELYDIDDTGRIPTITDRLKGGLGSIRDTVTDKLGSVGDFIKGGGILGQALKGLGNMFEYRGGIGYIDEDGVFRSADELDRLNARGGYYTDAARASRRRDLSIQKMLQRKAQGKRIGEQRLKDLLEQQAKEEAARQEAARAMQDSNRANRTGGYQSTYSQDTDFMEGDRNAGGKGTTATMGST
jgi:hypothetical protein